MKTESSPVDNIKTEVSPDDDTKTEVIGVRYTKAAQRRIIQRVFEKTNVWHDIRSAIRVMCEEEPLKPGAPPGNQNAKRKSNKEDKTS